jgi:hypothetical protein
VALQIDNPYPIIHLMNPIRASLGSLPDSTFPENALDDLLDEVFNTVRAEPLYDLVD